MKHYLLLFLPLLFLGCNSLEECLNDCPPIHSRDYICGEDGWVYRGECRLACHGLEPAQDELLCAAPMKNRECTRANKGKRRYYVERDCGLGVKWCDQPGGWMTTDHETSPLPNPCFSDCPPCPQDESGFVCGKKGVRYCNACVMECLEDEAGDESACGATASPAHFCDPETERYATRDWDGYHGRNICECAVSGLWHCTCWGYPAELGFP